MPATFKKLAPSTAVPTTGVTLYTVPSAAGNEVTQVRGLALTNYVAAAHAVSLWDIPAGGSVVSDNIRYGGISVPANSTLEMSFDEGEWCLNAGATIVVSADANSAINASLSGAELLA